MAQGALGDKHTMSRKQHQKFAPRKHFGNREGFKVEMQEILYYGEKQGYKIWLSDSKKAISPVLKGKTIKFPLTIGEWYTTTNPEDALEQAFRDLHDIVIHNYRR